MTYKTILSVFDHTVSKAGLQPAIELAKAGEIHLAILIIGIAPPSPLYVYGFPTDGITVIPEAWQEEITAGTMALSAKVREIEKIVQDADNCH